jgi:hypothetical protein
MLNKTQIEDIAKRVRINIVKMVNEAKSRPYRRFIERRRNLNDTLFQRNEY